MQAFKHALGIPVGEGVGPGPQQFQHPGDPLTDCPSGQNGGSSPGIQVGRQSLSELLGAAATVIAAVKAAEKRVRRNCMT